MKTLVISGSRNPHGQTARAVGALVEGICAGGSECEAIYLPQQNLRRCRQCQDDGWGTCLREGRCAIEDDDFSRLVDAIRSAGAVAFATPVYFGDLSESLRGFLDRLRRICRTDAGRAGISGKPALGLCVAGGGGGGSPNCCVSLERTLGHCGFDYVDSLPVRRQNLQMKLPILRMTGRWLATCPSSAPAGAPKS